MIAAVKNIKNISVTYFGIFHAQVIICSMVRTCGTKDIPL